MTKKILVVYHSQSGNTETMAKAVAKGARKVEGTDVVLKKAFDTSIDEFIEFDGYAFGSPDYFSYMAGGLKDIFDRTLYPSRGKIDDRPYVAFVSHGGGGTPALQSIHRCCRSMKLRQVGELLWRDRPDFEGERQCEGLGEKLARETLG